MPFEAGKVSNPTGRNGKEFKAALRLAVMRTEGDKTKLHRIAEALAEKALEGDVQAIREVADRMDGKPIQEIAGENGGPLVVEIVRLTQD